MKEQTFAQGECPNCGHDWTAHSDFIARGEKVCWTFDPAIMDERHPYIQQEAKALIGRMCASPLVIQYVEGDEIIHTDENPECDDPDCICHWERATQNEADIYGTHAPDCRCAWCAEEV